MEFERLMTLLRATVSGPRAIETASIYRAFPLKLSFSSYNAGLDWVKGQYTTLGLQAEKINFPADGKTTFGDRHFPLAWDIEEGWLKFDPSSGSGVGATSPSDLLASYQEDPYGIVPFSADSRGEQSGLLVPASDIKAGRKPAGDRHLVVLFDRNPTPLDVQWAIENGCKAIAGCYKIEPSNSVAYQARRWFNAMFGEGQIDERSQTLPGYSLSPSRVVELLEICKQKGPIPVRYLMRSHTYAGTLGAVLATLEGEDPQAKAMMLSAHGYEPNASNNVSGVAICLEAARLLTHLIGQGVLPKPQRSIKFFHGLETWGLYAYAVRNPEKMKQVLCGLTIDGIGTFDRNNVREVIELGRCPNLHASFWHALVERFVSESSRQLGLRYELSNYSFSTNDDMANDPLFGPAWDIMRGSIWCKGGGFYHSNADTIEFLSPERMAECAVLAAASAYTVASAGREAASAFAELACQDALKQYTGACAALVNGVAVDREAIIEKGLALKAYNQTVIPVMTAAIESVDELVTAEEREEFRIQIRPLSDRFKKAANGLTSGMLDTLAASLGGQPKAIFKSEPTPVEKELAMRVPTRRLPGVLGLGTLSKEARMNEAVPLAGRYADEYWNFMAPTYIWFDGRRTVLDAALAHYISSVDGKKVSRKQRLTVIEQFQTMTRFLEKYGYLDVRQVPPPPVVTRQTIIDGLRVIGIKAGDLVMVHSSLSQFGTVEGGPDAVIDALMEVVTPAGVLAMPAFSNSVDDSEIKPAFDPASTTAFTGIISNTFWRRSGVLRNAQPTHSLAAWGSRADEFLKTDNLDDTFDWNGPWGRLYRWDGKIINFGETMGATTYMHALEAWFLGYLSRAYARIKDGEGEKQVCIHNYPDGCRGGWYGLRRTAAYFQRLQSKGLYRETKIGNAAALTIRVRDMTRELHSLFQEDPAVFLHKKGCLFCAQRRAQLKDWIVPDRLPGDTRIV